MYLPYVALFCTSPITHLVYPPPVKENHNLCFSILESITVVPRKRFF